MKRERRELIRWSNRFIQLPQHHSVELHQKRYDGERGRGEENNIYICNTLKLIYIRKIKVSYNILKSKMTGPLKERVAATFGEGRERSANVAIENLSNK